MSRYIKAEMPFAFISRLMGCIPITLLDEYEQNGIDIVFCKECKYWWNEYGDSACMLHSDFAVNADDYCSYGEREDK